MYARLSLANKDMEPELVCFAPDNRAGGYGELEGGFSFTTSLTWAQRYGGVKKHNGRDRCVSVFLTGGIQLFRRGRLLAPDCMVLTALGAHMPFEICVGLNGRVWINSPSPKYTILVANAIQSAEALTDKQTAALVRDLLARLE